MKGKGLDQSGCPDRFGGQVPSRERVLRVRERSSDGVCGGWLGEKRWDPRALLLPGNLNTYARFVGQT